MPAALASSRAGLSASGSFGLKTIASTPFAIRSRMSGELAGGVRVAMDRRELARPGPTTSASRLGGADLLLAEAVADAAAVRVPDRVRSVAGAAAAALGAPATIASPARPTAGRAGASGRSSNMRSTRSRDRVPRPSRLGPSWSPLHDDAPHVRRAAASDRGPVDVDSSTSSRASSRTSCLDRSHGRDAAHALDRPRRTAACERSAPTTDAAGDDRRHGPSLHEELGDADLDAS